MKQQYLMLAHTYKDQNVGGWYVSEKLDGTRALWDGGISRGLPSSQIPYANTVKDYRLQEEPIATGLWTRSGKVIHAPDSFLDQLPNISLDGELHSTTLSFQEIRKIISKHQGNKTAWDDIYLACFDSPTIEAFGKAREIKVRNDYTFTIPECTSWIRKHSIANGTKLDVHWAPGHWLFEHVIIRLENRCNGDVAYPVKQTKLPLSSVLAKQCISTALTKVLRTGGEGLVLRNPVSIWVTERSRQLLKVKSYKDAEGTLVGFTAGKGKYLGMIGALVINVPGLEWSSKAITLELSGMTDEERALVPGYIGTTEPGAMLPNDAEAKHFKIEDQITFRYRELSDDGVPKEGRYLRKR